MNIEEKLNGITEQIQKVSVIASEMAQTRQTVKIRYWRAVAIIFLIALLVSNALWIMHCSQFEKVVETTETFTTATTFEDVEQYADGGGNNIIAGGDVNGG